MQDPWPVSSAGAADARSAAAACGSGAGNQDQGEAGGAESGAADLEGKGWEREAEAQDKVMSDAKPEDDGRHQEATSGAAQAALDNGGSVGHQPTSGSIEEATSKPT